jgi:Cutinase
MLTLVDVAESVKMIANVIAAIIVALLLLPESILADKNGRQEAKCSGIHISELMKSNTDSEILGQSCFIAYLSGSTKQYYPPPANYKAPKTETTGSTCIKKHLLQLGAPVPGEKPLPAPVNYPVSPKSVGKVTCKPNMLIYARGTMEPGAFGMTVGPRLCSALFKTGSVGTCPPSTPDWGMIGITDAEGYHATFPDDSCLALEGGRVCKEVLSQVAKTCPDSNFVLAGYSQGAMVARICAAYSDPILKRRIKVCRLRQLSGPC